MSIQVEEIPDDIRDTAARLAATPHAQRVVAAALLAERERATRVQIEEIARLVERSCASARSEEEAAYNSRIAASIRSQLTGG